MHNRNDADTSQNVAELLHMTAAFWLCIFGLQGAMLKAVLPTPRCSHFVTATYTAAINSLWVPCCIQEWLVVRMH